MSHEYEEMQVEKWVNLEDVAEHLSISQDTVRTWIKEGSCPCTGLANDINSKSLKLTNGSAKAKFRNEL
jgi:predicted site-specific integrase-resolvase